ncbi:carboxypeptidase regulatory-like domain-containing protein [Candidatus Latescibacterota bacterium]
MYGIIAMMFLFWIGVVRLRIRSWIINSDAVIDPRIINVFQETGKRLALNKDVVIVENDDVPAPFTCRWLRPMVILPTGYTDDLTTDELRAVATHELAHVQRNDVLMLTAVSLVRALFFFHPLVWVVSRQISYLAEVSCDNAVLDSQVKSESYASMLARLAVKMPAHSVSIECAAGFLFTRSIFFRRIESILSGCDDRMRRVPRLSLAVTAGVAILSLVTALSLPIGYAREDWNKVTISGKVLYENAPVEDAEILFSDIVHNEVISIDKTGAHGAFSFTVDREMLGSERWYQPAVIAFSEKHAIGWQTITGIIDFKNVVIQLKDEHVFSGIVQDQNKKPIEGAEVSVSYIFATINGFRNFMQIQPGLLKPLTVMTDNEGKFSIRHIPVGAGPSFSANKKGFGQAFQFYNPKMPDIITITMNPGGQVSGKVINGETGKPVENALIIANPTSGLPSNTISDKDGNYTLSGLSVGEYHVSLSFHNEASYMAAATIEKVKVLERETKENVDFTLLKGGFVTGVVIDEDSGDPVARQWIGYQDHTRSADQPSMRFTSTDEAGKFTLAVPPGFARVFTTVPDGYEAVGTLIWETEVADGDTVEVEPIRFSKGITLVGITRTFEGKPVSDVVITAGGPVSIYATSRSDGTFSISGLSQGTKLTLNALRSDMQLRSTVELDVQEGTVVDILLDKYETTTISGRVIDNDGKSVKGAKAMLIWWQGDSGGGHTIAVETTDETGRYTLDGLILGDQYMAEIEADGYASPSLGRKDQFEAEKDMPPRPDVVLVRSGRWIEGKVVDGTGKPLVRAQVSTHQGSGGSIRAFTGADGTFRLENLIGIMVDRMSVHYGDYGFYEFKYVPTNLSTTVTLKKGTHYAHGRVIDNEGNPIEGASVYTGSSSRESGQVIVSKRTDAEGRFRFSNIIIEKIDLNANHDKFQYKSVGEIQLDRDDIEIVLEEKPSADPGLVLDKDDAAAYEPYKVRRITGKADITIDGGLSDWAGYRLEPTKIQGINPDLGGGWPTIDDETEFSASMQLIGDDAFLYLAVSVIDDELDYGNQPFSRPYSDDCIEILFHCDDKEEREALLWVVPDKDGGTRIEGQVPSTQGKFPYLWQALGVRAVLKQTNTGYIAGCSVPWSALEHAGWTGDRLKGLNVRVYDSDDANKKNYLNEWATASGLNNRELAISGGNVKEGAYKTEQSDTVFGILNDANEKKWDRVKRRLERAGDYPWVKPMRAILASQEGDMATHDALFADYADEAPDEYIQDWVTGVLQERARNMDRNGQSKKAAEILGSIMESSPRTSLRYSAQLTLAFAAINASRFSLARRALEDILSHEKDVLDMQYNGPRTLSSAQQMLEALDRIEAEGKK